MVAGVSMPAATALAAERERITPAAAGGRSGSRPGTVKIDTVAGPIDPDGIGKVLAHEHLYVDFWGPTDPNYLEPINGFEAAVDVIVPYVNEVKAQGVDLVFDWAPLGVGRSVETAKMVWERTGVHVAVPSGIYKNLRPPEFLDATVDELTEFMVDEFVNGIGETGIKPAFIKIAASPVPAIGEMEIHRAAAQAAAETGAAIACHLPFPIDARNGVETARARQVFEIVRSHGVAPEKFVWGHASGIISALAVDDGHLNASLMQHFELAAEGVTLQFDAVGAEPVGEPEPYFGGPTDPEVFLRILEAFVNLGYGDRVLISNDASVYVNPGGGPAGEHAADFEAAGLPVWQYPRDIRYLYRTFEPLMVDRIGSGATHQILSGNPLRVFGRVRSPGIDRSR